MSSSTPLTPAATPSAAQTTFAPAATAPVAAQPMGDSVQSGASIPPVVSLAPSTATIGYEFPCTDVGEFGLHTGGLRYNFRAHSRVAEYLKDFAVVELVAVKAVIYLSRCHGFGVTNATPQFRDLDNISIRFGIAPRTIDTHTGGTTSTPVVTSVGKGVMRLQTGVLSQIWPSVLTYDVATATMPPGIQTDLRAIETRHPYPRMYISNLFPLASDNGILLRVQIDFTVRCSGSNFGGPGL